MEYNWSFFSVRVPISASKDSIFDAWLSQEMLELWFLRKAEFTTGSGEVRSMYEKVQAGDDYCWLWHGYDDTSAEYGKILAIPENGGYFKFSFGKAGVCTISVQELENESVLEIKQEQIPIDEASKVRFHLGCMQGWTFYAANLKSLLEGGIDLRNKNLNIKNVINA